MSFDGPTSPPPPPPGGFGTPPPQGPGGPGYGGVFGGGQFGGGQFGGSQFGGGGPGGFGGPGGTPPPNYLVWSILTTLFCCLPLGIASIVFAAQVNTKWTAGDAAGALDSSQKAKKFAIWSAIAGPIVFILYALLGGLAALSGNSV